MEQLLKTRAGIAELVEASRIDGRGGRILEQRRGRNQQVQKAHVVGEGGGVDNVELVGCVAANAVLRFSEHQQIKPCPGAVVLSARLGGFQVVSEGVAESEALRCDEPKHSPRSSLDESAGPLVKLHACHLQQPCLGVQDLTVVLHPKGRILDQVGVRCCQMEAEQRAGRVLESRAGREGDGKERIWDYRSVRRGRARQSCFPVVLDGGEKVPCKRHGERGACSGDILLSGALPVAVPFSRVAQLLFETIPVGGMLSPAGMLCVLGPDEADGGEGLLIAEPQGVCVGACVPVLQAARAAEQLLCLAGEHLEVAVVDVEVVVQIPHLLPRDRPVVVQKEGEEQDSLGWVVLARLQGQKSHREGLRAMTLTYGLPKVCSSSWQAVMSSLRSGNSWFAAAV